LLLFPATYPARRDRRQRGALRSACSHGQAASQLGCGSSFAYGNAAALIVVLFCTSNEFVIKDYYLSAAGDDPGLMNRSNTYKYDFRVPLNM